MGESRGGEGSGHEVTTTKVTKYLVRQYKDQGIEIERVNVQLVTEGLYAVEILERGTNEPETFFLGIEG